MLPSLITRTREREIERKLHMEKTELIKKEIKKQMRLGGPLIAANLLLTLLILISIIIVGHLGDLAFAGAALAISFAAVTGFSMLLGLGCALETLCGQAFGAKQYQMLGVQLQKAMLVLTLSCIPVAVIWLFAEKVLIFLHQDSEISEKAGVYIRWMLPSLFAYGLVQCQIRFLQTQNLVMPLMLGAGSTALIHGLASWALVYRTGIGYVGAALATSLSYWYMVVFLALYIKFSPACRTTWSGFSTEALRGVHSFIKLATPSAVMIIMEYWSFEAIVILSGLLPNPKLETSTMSSCLSICTTLYMIPFGIGATISTRVSNELGARNPRAAKLAIFVILVIGTVEAMLLGMTIILMRNIWGQVVSKDKVVISHMASVMPLVAVVQIIDAYQCVLAGIVRGCGWQKICTIINLGSFYGVGLPISVLLAFKFHMGGKGLWTGIICALLIQVLLLGIITIRSDWDEEARKAVERIQNLSAIGDMTNPSPPQRLDVNDLQSIEFQSEEKTFEMEASFSGVGMLAEDANEKSWRRGDYANMMR